MATVKFASKANLVSLLTTVRGWISSAVDAIPFASKTVAGKVKIGAGLNVTAEGVVSLDNTAVDSAITAKGYQTAAQVKATADASAKTAADKAKQDILGGAVPETLDTIKELSDWINDHNDVASGLTNQLAGKADKATTLAGYGITDAKIDGGVITLGNATITPITAHQSLAAYAKTADVYTKTQADSTFAKAADITAFTDAEIQAIIDEVLAA